MKAVVERLAVTCATVLALAACGPTEPDPSPRVLSVAPEGTGVPPDAPGISVRFSEPVEASGVEDGRFVALALDADAKPVATAAASATGIGPGTAVVPARIVLEEAGTVAAVTPDAPLAPEGAYAVVVGTGIRSVSGRAVLDPTGRKRAFAGTFRTGPMPDRIPPVARWLSPPHGPVPRNLKEVRLGFSEPVTGSPVLRGVAARAHADAPDVTTLTLDAPLPGGDLVCVLDGVRDAGGNAALPLPGIPVASCRDDRPPVVDAATVRVLGADTSVSVAADASEVIRLGVEVAAERIGDGCGAVPEPPGSLVVWSGFTACPGHDPCGAAVRCPSSATAPGLCPGRRVKVRVLAEDLAGNAAPPGPWILASTAVAAPRPVLTEVLADAATPQAGGEYVEVANLGSGEADLAGWKLAKRGATGTVTRCTIEPRGGPLPPGAHGLVVGGSWDGRYPLPPGVPLFTCGATALLGGLADDRAPAVALESPGGVVESGIGWASPGPRCTGRSVERIQPGGEDAAANLACARAAPGTPGACNGSTPAADCPRRPY